MESSCLTFKPVFEIQPSHSRDFPHGAVAKNLPASAEDEKDVGLIPGWEGSPGKGNRNSFWYLCLRNPMDIGAWQAIVHGVAKSWTQMSVCMCAHTHTYTHTHIIHKGFPGGTSGKEPAWQCRRHKRWGFDPWVGKIPWRRAWQPTPVFLPGESHGQRSLWATDHRVSKSQTWLKWLSTLAHY